MPLAEFGLVNLSQVPVDGALADYGCGPGQNTIAPSAVSISKTNSKCLFLLDCQSDKELWDQATCLLGKTFPNLELKTIKSCYRDIKNQIPDNSVAIGWSNYMLNWLSGIGVFRLKLCGRYCDVGDLLLVTV